MLACHGCVTGIGALTHPVCPTWFDGEENHAVESNKEYVKFKTGSSSGSSTTYKASTTKRATAATGDPTSVVGALVAAVAGAGFWIAGLRKRR